MPYRRAMSSAISIHGPPVIRWDLDASHASRPRPIISKPMLTLKPAIHIDVNRRVTLVAAAASDAASRAGFDDSDPAAAEAIAGRVTGAAAKRLAGGWCWSTGAGPIAMCHAGTISSSAGVAAAHTIAADKIQC